MMETLGAVLRRVEAGRVTIGLSYNNSMTQQHGYLHAGALAAVLDSACGYAALTLAPEGSEVLSVEFKLNLLRPARGRRFEARARVIRPGRTISVCQADAYVVDEVGERLIATMLGTMMRVNAEDQPQL